MVDLHRAIEHVLARRQRRSARPIRQAVGWLTPRASARRTDDKPSSDCNISHIALQPKTQR
jgi:hypothetical protein